MSHLLFISTHNFATNPRLVKEVKLALRQGYQVSVLCCEYSNWSKQNNEAIKKELLPFIHYYPVSGDRSPLKDWLMSSAWYSAARFVSINTKWLSIGSNKRSWLLLNMLPKIKERIDLVIAHNPGSFYPAQVFAKQKNSPFGIDLEDYHPGETNDVKEAARLRKLNAAVLPAANYVTAASPLILDYSKADVTGPLRQELLLLNYFSKEEFQGPVKPVDDRLQLVWFSQNISRGRGLEEIIPLIKNSPACVLHLYGNTDPVFCTEWLTGVDNIVLHPALPQAELHLDLHQYDVGLALEKPASNLNRDLCITNKILAYYQAGLYILASDTSAQQLFMQEHPNAGIICRLHSTALADSLQSLLDNKDQIRKNATLRFEEAATHNWEKESSLLIKTWKQLLH